VGRVGMMMDMPVGRAEARGHLGGLEKRANRNNATFCGGEIKALPQGWSKALQQRARGHAEADGRWERDWWGAQGLEPTLLKEGTGARPSFSPEKGRPRDCLQMPGGRGGKNQCPSIDLAPCWAGAGAGDALSTQICASP